MTFDLRTGKPKASYPFPAPASACNDIAVDNDGTAYATDTPNGRIFRVKPGASTLELFMQDRPAERHRRHCVRWRRRALRKHREPRRADSCRSQVRWQRGRTDGADALGTRERARTASGSSREIVSCSPRGRAGASTWSPSRVMPRQIRVLKDGLNSPPGVTLGGQHCVRGRRQDRLSAGSEARRAGSRVPSRPSPFRSELNQKRISNARIPARVLAGAPCFSGLSLIGASHRLPANRAPWNAVDCDYKCLTGMVRGYMDALAKKDPTRAKLAPNVRFTENNIRAVARARRPLARR